MIKEISELLKEFKEEYAGIVKEELDRILSQPNVHLFIVRDGSRIVGVAFGYIVETFLRKALIFDEFVIHPDYRGKGCGKQLLEQIIECARKHNCSCVECTVKESNEIAQKLYGSYGFYNRRNMALRLWLD